jgi:hypothetical protein
MRALRNEWPECEIACGDVERWEYSRTRKDYIGMLVRAIDYYVPFVSANVVYANTRIVRELGSACPVMEGFEEYCCDLLAWISREEAIRESSNP